MADEKKSEEQILFPEVEVGGVTVKPWSFGKLLKISETLETILDRLDEKGILNEIAKTNFITTVLMAKIFSVAGQGVGEIMCVTLDKDREFIDDLSMEDGVKIALTIYQQNTETIKNALSPVLTYKEIKDAAG